MPRSVEMAESCDAGLCPDADCRTIHIRLFDEDNELFAVAGIMVEDIPKVIKKLQELAYECVTTRDKTGG